MGIASFPCDTRSSMPMDVEDGKRIEGDTFTGDVAGFA